MSDMHFSFLLSITKHDIGTHLLLCEGWWAWSTSLGNTHTHAHTHTQTHTHIHAHTLRRVMSVESVIGAPEPDVIQSVHRPLTWWSTNRRGLRFWLHSLLKADVVQFVHWLLTWWCKEGYSHNLWLRYKLPDGAKEIVRKPWCCWITLLAGSPYWITSWTTWLDHDQLDHLLDHQLDHLAGSWPAGSSAGPPGWTMTSWTICWTTWLDHDQLDHLLDHQLDHLDLPPGWITLQQRPALQFHFKRRRRSA